MSKWSKHIHDCFHIKDIVQTKVNLIVGKRKNKCRLNQYVGFAGMPETNCTLRLVWWVRRAQSTEKFQESQKCHSFSSALRLCLLLLSLSHQMPSTLLWNCGGCYWTHLIKCHLQNSYWECFIFFLFLVSFIVMFFELYSELFDWQYDRDILILLNFG